MTPVLLTFEHDEDEDGWCSFCKNDSPRGVRIREADITGGVPQIRSTFEPEGDREERKSRKYFYRIGTCCIGKMVGALETRGAK